MHVPAPTLRLYRPSDLEALYQIDQACFPAGIAYGRKELKSYVQSEDSVCIIAEISGAIAGFIVSERSGQLAHVITLDVTADHRRRLVGSFLLEYAEREATARGARLMYLETATTNKTAIALWKKHGYREAATIEDYYGPGLDAFEMHKLLNASARAGRI